MAEIPAHDPHGSPSPANAGRGHLSTERRNPASAAIDALSTAQVLAVMNGQDLDVPRIVRQAIPALTKLIDDLVERMQRGGRLIYLGAGTSGRLGVLDASECPPTFHTDPGEVVGLIAGGDAALRNSSEGGEDDPDGARAELQRLGLNENDMVVGIAAGGTTPYVWGALRFAHERAAATALITCVALASLKVRRRAPTVAPNEPVSAMPPAALPVPIDHPIELPVGPEVIAGSTRLKAGTATKLALNMITTTAMIRRGKTWGNLMVDLRATNVKLRERATRILTEQAGLPVDDAAALLDQAGGRVKLALVMAKLNVDADEAQRKLAEHAGKLRPLIGAPR